MLGLHPIDLQVSLEQMIPLVYKDHIYQHHKVHLLQFLPHLMGIILLHHHLVDLMDLQVLMEILHHLVDLMDLPVLVEILHPLPHLPVEEGVVADPHLLPRHLADQMDLQVPIIHLSIIEAELLTPELPHKS